jgi:hypothetical protein
MNIPNKLKIGGYNYSVKLDPKLIRDNGHQGSQCANGLEILIDPNLPKENQESVMLHEILEAINYHYALNLEHDKIMVLETALYQVIKDNIDIFKEVV